MISVKISKISISVKITENFRFPPKISKISMAFKISKNFEFGQKHWKSRFQS